MVGAVRLGGHGAYPAPTVVLFSDLTSSACGVVRRASGPFYCVNDRRIYVEPTYLSDLPANGGIYGDFVQAYLIAHEVGRHVRQVLDPAAAAQDVAAAEAPTAPRPGEPRADCYAGVWFHFVRERRLVDADELEQGVPIVLAMPPAGAANDRAERARSFDVGLSSGDPRDCRTRAARR